MRRVLLTTRVMYGYFALLRARPPSCGAEASLREQRDRTRHARPLLRARPPSHPGKLGPGERGVCMTVP